MNKCEFINCKKKLNSLLQITGKCKLCNKTYCSNHRLIEEHKCQEINRTKNKDLLVKKLLECKTNSTKIKII